MKNQITIGSKIGFLNKKKNKYDWAKIVGMTDKKFTIEQKYKNELHTFDMDISIYLLNSSEKTIKIICNKKLY